MLRGTIKIKGKLLYIMVVLFFLALSSVMAAFPAGNQFFGFDETAGLVVNDLGTMEVNGLLNGSIDRPVGRNATGKAINFSLKDNYLDTGFRPGNNSEFAIAVWVKDDRDYHGDFARIWARDEGGANDAVALFINSSPAGVVTFVHRSSGSQQMISSSSVVTDGNWHHIVAMYNTTHFNLFVDGTLESNRTGTLGTFTFTKNITLGAASDGAGPSIVSFYNGTAEDYRVYLKDNLPTNAQISEMALAGNFQVTASNLHNSSTIKTFKLEVDGTTYSTTTGTITTTLSRVTGGLFNVTFFNNTFLYNITIEDDVSTDLAATLQPVRVPVNVTVVQLNRTPLDTFNVTITNVNESVSGATSTGFLVINTLNISSNVSTSATNFVINESKYLGFSYLQLLNITLFKANYLDLTFRDENTNNIILKNLTVNIIGDKARHNGSTETGRINFTIPLPDNYTIRSQAASYYGLKLYELEITNQTLTFLTIYLVNDTEQSDVIITVIDQNLEVVPDAKIEVFRYKPNQNTFILTEVLKTNFEGEAVAHIILNDEWYKFRILVNNEEKLFTSSTFIFDTSLTLQINTQSPFGVTEKQFRGVNFNLSFTNTTNLVTYTWNDPNSNVIQACLDIFEITSRTKILKNNTCSLGASGTIFLGVENGTHKNYRADAFIDLPTESNIHLSSISFGQKENIGGLAGLFYLIMVQLVFLFAFRFGIPAGLIAFPFPMLAASVIGIVAYPLYMTFTLAIMCWVVAIIIGVKGKA